MPMFMATTGCLRAMRRALGILYQARAFAKRSIRACARQRRSIVRSTATSAGWKTTRRGRARNSKIICSRARNIIEPSSVGLTRRSGDAATPSTKRATTMADVVLTVHFMFVVFVVGALPAIWIGAALRWRWVCNFKFRLAHLGAIGFVALESVLGI